MRISLGVLLLIIAGVTFFVFTTTKSFPTVMELKMPKDEPSANEKPGSNATLTLVLLKNDMLYGYFGNNINDGSNLEIKDASKIILEGIQKFTRDSLIVVIKPSEEANYKNTVDILDEMTIHGIKNYKMVDLNEQEKAFLAKAE